MQENSADSPRRREAGYRVPLAEQGRNHLADIRTACTPAFADKIAARAPSLPRSERVLLEQVFIHGWTIARIATLTGEPTRKVSRRVKRLAARTLAEPFALVTMHSSDWSAELRAVGEAVFVRGLSVKAAAAVAGVPYSVAMLHARTIRALAKSTQPARTRKRGAA